MTFEMTSPETSRELPGAKPHRQGARAAGGDHRRRRRDKAEQSRSRARRWRHHRHSRQTGRFVEGRLGGPAPGGRFDNAVLPMFCPKSRHPFTRPGLCWNLSGERRVECFVRRNVPAMSHTVLVVDDDPAVLDVIVGMLEDLGCEVISAQSGPDALGRLEQNQT